MSSRTKYIQKCKRLGCDKPASRLMLYCSRDCAPLGQFAVTDRKNLAREELNDFKRKVTGAIEQLEQMKRWMDYSFGRTDISDFAKHQIKHALDHIKSELK